MTRPRPPDLATACPACLGLAVARLDATEPDHPVLVALRLAVELAVDRRRQHRALRAAGLELHGGDPVWGQLADRWRGIGHPDRVSAARTPQLPARCDRCHARLDPGRAA